MSFLVSPLKKRDCTLMKLWWYNNINLATSAFCRTLAQTKRNNACRGFLTELKIQNLPRISKGTNFLRLALLCRQNRLSVHDWTLYHNSGAKMCLLEVTHTDGTDCITSTAHNGCKKLRILLTVTVCSYTWLHQDVVLLKYPHERRSFGYSSYLHYPLAYHPVSMSLT